MVRGRDRYPGSWTTDWDRLSEDERAILIKIRDLKDAIVHVKAYLDRHPWGLDRLFWRDKVIDWTKEVRYLEETLHVDSYKEEE